jgi:hypothetical protein
VSAASSRSLISQRCREEEKKKRNGNLNINNDCSSCECSFVMFIYYFSLAQQEE